MNYLTTDEIVNKVKETIVPLESQNKALYDIASTVGLYLKWLKAIDNGQNAVLLPKVSQLIVAPTGCGKTFLINQIAKAADLEFISIDVSSLTPSGYKGENLDSVLADALASIQNEAARKRCVVLFDEFDKMAFGRNGRDAFYNPQSNFLTILEGRKVSNPSIPAADDKESYDTSEILFLFAGAFEGIENGVQSGRNAVQTIGFGPQNSNRSDSLQSSDGQITQEDIIKYGFSRELIGRIGSVMTIPKLSSADYVQLIKNPNTGVEAQYAALFANSGVSFSISQRAIKRIAEEAQKMDLGARAVKQIVNKSMLTINQEIDRDPYIVEAELDADKGHFCAKYIRSDQKRANAEQASTDRECDECWKEYNFSTQLSSEVDLDCLCAEILLAPTTRQADANYEMAEFCFLQAALRWLDLSVVEEDRNFSSLSEMAVAARRHHRKDATAIDILMEECIEQKKDPQKTMAMSKFYEKYRELETKQVSFFVAEHTEEYLWAWCHKHQTEQREPVGPTC